MSYLDDPENTWELDPNATRGTAQLLQELTDREKHDEDPEALDLIFRGCVGLLDKHPNASIAKCLETSMIWFYG